jgi:spore germination cell wall hydrolase CwlJ-like protein
VRSVASRRGPKGVATPFGLLLTAFAFFPTQIGYQDLAALIARQPAVQARWHEHLLASPFGTIHAAIFSFPRPLGAEMPEPPAYRLASFFPSGAEVTGALGTEPVPGYKRPTIVRRLKGDRLVARPAPQAQPGGRDAAAPAEAPATTAARPEPPDDPLGAELSAALREPPLSGYTVWAPLDADPQVPGFIPADLVDPDEARQAWGAHADNAPVGAAHLYFSVDPMGSNTEALERWAPGDAPIEVGPGATADPAAANDAAKGEVTAEHKGLQSPAERLGLDGKARAKAEKCLADAVYFEARGEPVRGQIAVAQVVMNRVFSGFYPDNVCGVVYQNAHRHLACQFTFACSRISFAINEPEAWERAKRIAKETLDGKLWLPEVGKATHYHAYWVRPSWVHEMKKLYKFGVHTFYRPRAWGNGADAPAWGDAATTAAEAAKL